MKRRRKKKKRIKILVCVLLTIIILLIASYVTVRAIGKNNLQSRTRVVVPEISQIKTELLTEQEKVEWQEGWVKYEDTIYAYNEDIMTFLFMGIDKDGEAEAVAEGTDGGQADALFLLVLNPHDKTIKVIGINRNAMTDIDIYNEEGAYVTTTTAQIAVQHGFGDGMEKSCKYQVDAVQKLFYNLPIHGYCAVNMGVVISLTDLIGGIELTSLEDVRSTFIKEGEIIVKKDEHVLLDGKKAYSYVRYRDIHVEKSADARLKRQQQFLEEFMNKTKTATKEDITLPVKMYQTITEQMVTDVTADEVAYLASSVLDYRFDSSQFYSLKGETVMGEQFEEFYIDEDALYEMILDIFYEPVKR